MKKKYDKAQGPGRRANRRSREAFTIIECFVVLLTVFVLTFLLIPAFKYYVLGQRSGGSSPGSGEGTVEPQMYQQTPPATSEDAPQSQSGELEHRAIGPSD